MMKLDLTRKGNGIELPLPLWTETSEARSWRVGVRGYGLSIDRNPSPGSHLAMRSDLSHKGRGEVRRRQNRSHPRPTHRQRIRLAFAGLGAAADPLDRIDHPAIALEQIIRQSHHQPVGRSGR